MPVNQYEISVLYVEDDPGVKEEIAEILARRVKTIYMAENGQIGLELYQKYEPDLVITDLAMPVMDGLKLSREIKTINRNAKIIVTTAYNDSNYFIESIDIGISHYVLKPIEIKKLVAAIEQSVQVIELERRIKTNEIMLQNAHDELEKRIEERTRELTAANSKLQLEILERERVEQVIQENNIYLKNVMKEIVNALAATVQVTESYTAEHQQNVAQLSMEIARELGFSEDQIEGIWVGGMLHDIGKIYVPRQILNKRSKLTEIEFALIKTHPQVGYDIIQKIPFAWPVAQVILQHHERINGSGYPAGISGESININARILAVADVVEAITAHRPYRPALGIEKALEEISSQKGILYDTQVVEACIKVIQARNIHPVL